MNPSDFELGILPVFRATADPSIWIARECEEMVVAGLPQHRIDHASAIAAEPTDLI